MFIENFQKRYSSLPVATFSRTYRQYTSSQDAHSLPHMHRELELLLVLDGEALLHTDSQAYPLEKGDIVVISPYTLHSYTIFADRNFAHYCLCFDLDILYDKQLKTSLENGSRHINHIIHNQSSCAEYIQRAYLAHQEKKPGWEMAVIGNIHLFFGIIVSEGYTHTAGEASASSVYSQIYHYISAHSGENITSSSVAAHLGFNNSYFCRLFRKSFGDTFQNYLCKFRIELSKQLLRNSDTPISRIAADVGFSSFSYFSKKFKEYTRATPSAYRAQKKSLLQNHESK